MTLLEAIVWIVGMAVVPVDSTYRWVVFLVGVVCALRVPRSFLENDFHGAYRNVFVAMLHYSAVQ